MSDVSKVKDYVESVYNLNNVHISRITDGVTNTNFCVSASEGKYLFKVYNFKNLTEVLFEVGVLQALAQNNFLSPRLVQRKDKQYVGSLDEKPCLAYSFIEGKSLQKWDEGVLDQVGEYMGDMHVMLEGFEDTSKNGIFDLENIKALVNSQGYKFEEAGFSESEKLLFFLKEKLASFSFPEGLPKGITHHDIKPENVILKEGKLVGVIDFDLTYYGVLLNDIATTIIWSCFEGSELNSEKTKAFLKGYEQKRSLTDLERKYLPDAIHFRLVREAFSSPFDVLPNHMEITKQRSDMFIACANSFEQVKDSIKISF